METGLLTSAASRSVSAPSAAVSWASSSAGITPVVLAGTVNGATIAKALVVSGASTVMVVRAVTATTSFDAAPFKE